MPKQPAFPGLRDAMKKKKTRREVFLSEMDAVVPWVRSASPSSLNFSQSNVSLLLARRAA
jgi:hypothetical protein